MIECLVLGDSIAVGVGQYRPECAVVARVGISSRTYVNTYSVKDARTTIISLGSNDGAVEYRKELEGLREGLHGRVVWLLSANNTNAAEMARAIAVQNGDAYISVSSVPNDGLHPTSKGYKMLAQKTKE